MTKRSAKAANLHFIATRGEHRFDDECMCRYGRKIDSAIEEAKNNALLAVADKIEAEPFDDSNAAFKDYKKRIFQIIAGQMFGSEHSIATGTEEEGK